MNIINLRNPNHFENTQNINLDKFKENCEEYMNSLEFQKEMKKFENDIRRRKRNQISLWIKSNILTLINLLISVVTLAFTTLTFLMALHQ